MLRVHVARAPVPCPARRRQFPPERVRAAQTSMALQSSMALSRRAATTPSSSPTSIAARGRQQSRTDRIVRENRHVHYGDRAHRGYSVVDVTPARCTARLRFVDDVTDRHKGVRTAATFAIDAGRPAARMV